MGNALSKLSRIRTALEAAKSLDEIIDIRDQANAVTTYAKAIGLSVQNVNAAVEVKLRAERKAGALLADMDKRTNQHGAGNTLLPALCEIGITKIQSHRWQKIAEMPDESFDSFVYEANDQGKELTTAAVMREWSSICKPSNGGGLSSRDTLSAALERLHGAVKRIYADWPEDSRKQLADKLRAYADELDETGELAL